FRDLGIDVGSGGAGNTAVVMTGISEALITTAGGILVAVEAGVLYHSFPTPPAPRSIQPPVLSDAVPQALRARPAGGAPAPRAAARAAGERLPLLERVFGGSGQPAFHSRRIAGGGLSHGDERAAGGWRGRSGGERLRRDQHHPADRHLPRAAHHLHGDQLGD